MRRSRGVGPMLRSHVEMGDIIPRREIPEGGICREIPWVPGARRHNHDQIAHSADSPV